MIHCWHLITQIYNFNNTSKKSSGHILEVVQFLHIFLRIMVPWPGDHTTLLFTIGFSLSSNSDAKETHRDHSALRARDRDAHFNRNSTKHETAFRNILNTHSNIPVNWYQKQSNNQKWVYHSNHMKQKCLDWWNPQFS